MDRFFAEFEKVCKIVKMYDVLSCEWSKVTGARIFVKSVEQVDALCDNAKLTMYDSTEYYHEYGGVRNGIRVFALVTPDKALALGQKPETEGDIR